MMRPCSAEIFHPGIRDFYAIEGESVDRVLQEPGLLAGRFYEDRLQFGPHDLYRDARKSSTTAHVNQPPGVEERSVQKATQRIQDMLQHDPALVPGADDVRTVVGG